MFSSRLPAAMRPNRLARAVARARATGAQVLDLTLTNPTRAGIRYPEGMLAALGADEGRRYDPRPFGLDTARAAVAADYRRHGIDIDTDRLVLTASTSEAYSFLFKLLCEPGDRVLAPVPSYPLFEHLAALDAVGMGTYPLEYHGRWALDVEALDAAWDDRVRTVLAVSPNNPTGSVLSTHEVDELSERCAARGAAFIVDEVFADYLLQPRPTGPRATEPRTPACLTFRLGGLSKSAGLPQVKLGWIAVEGPEHLVSAAMERLEWICDTYLSVSIPVQLAAAALIEQGVHVRAQILERVRRNYTALRALAASAPSVDVLQADGGWSAVLRVPATRPEEELVFDLLERDRVLVHPGFFFDFPHEAFLVVSLLPEPDAFNAGMIRVLERAHA